MLSTIAGRYDLLSFRQDTAWRKFAISKCDIETGSPALDAATGTIARADKIPRLV